jgi:flagellar basal-body rod protein FlgC
MIHFIPGASSTAAALTAERTRLEVIAQNIANANTTRGLDGQPYRRQTVLFETALSEAQASGVDGLAPSGPRVSQVVPDSRPGRTVLAPGHPDADAKGRLTLPNVDIHEEMADMVVASRTFEANLAVLKNARQLAMMTLSIGKR